MSLWAHDTTIKFWKIVQMAVKAKITYLPHTVLRSNTHVCK